MAIPLWQRFVVGGIGPELTLAEAAAALGVSVQTARRLIRQGKLLAHKTPSGRFRVSPYLAPPPEPESNLADLWQELKRLSALLQETRNERDTLKVEIGALEARLEVALLAQSVPGQPTLLTFARSEVTALKSGHDVIQGMIVAARRKSKRRLWLWRLTA